ncbi:MAG: glycerophosphodiester phosphodiesterase [Gemmatimonadota bacterium]
MSRIFGIRPRPGRPYLAGAPLLIAHRGGARLAPENTLVAFRQAVERWEADILEMDVRATADGEIVVIHDARVDRTCDGTGRVDEMTWAEIRELDAGHHFIDEEGRSSFRGRGVRIPRFEEILRAFPHMRLNVDSKAPDAAAGLVALIRKHEAGHRVLVASAEESHRREARGYPGPWGASRRQIRAFWLLHRLHLSRFGRIGADALQVPPSWEGRTIVTPRFVRDAHRANIPIHVWTVDDPDDMRRFLDWGIDGIQTDRPDRLARVLVEEAGRAPPPGLAGG